MKQLRYGLGLMVIIRLTSALLSQSNNLSTNWSDYLGEMNWNEAKIKCGGLGMRLPTQDELKAVYDLGATKSWEPKGYYWTSTDSSEDLSRARSVDISLGDIHGFHKDINYGNVRCILLNAPADK